MSPAWLQHRWHIRLVLETSPSKALGSPLDGPVGIALSLNSPSTIASNPPASNGTTTFHFLQFFTLGQPSSSRACMLQPPHLRKEQIFTLIHLHGEDSKKPFFNNDKYGNPETNLSESKTLTCQNNKNDYLKAHRATMLDSNGVPAGLGLGSSWDPGRAGQAGREGREGRAWKSEQCTGIVWGPAPCRTTC